METQTRSIEVRSYLDLFSNLSHIVSQTTNLSGLLKSCVQVIQSILQVESCSIMLVNAEGTALDMMASSSIPEDVWGTIRASIGEGVAGKVAREGKPVMTRSAGEAASPAVGESGRRYRSASFICVPLKTAQATIGVVNVTDRMDREELTTFDLDVLRAIAEVIASAIENQRLWVSAQQSKERLSNVVDGLPIGMFTINASGLLTLCNRAARRYLHLSPTIEIDQLWEERFPEPLRSTCRRCLEELGRGESSCTAEIRIGMPGDGTERAVRLSAFEGEDLTSLESRDIVFLVEDLQQMEELIELRRSDQMKSNFLSLISHELRTPLASIKGAIHLLDQMWPAETRERAGHIFAILHRSSDRLTRLVNNILDVMDLEARTLTLYRKPADLHALVTRIVKKHESGEGEKSVAWHVDLRAERKEIYVDEGRFGQVVDHLVENAVKFTNVGGRIDVTSENRDGQWILRVANSGREIDPDFRERVFTRFFQVDGTLTRDSGGSGLGLYLCREIVRLHGGDIRVDPTFEGGSRFVVTIPEVTRVE
ncbi:GAF domain-containing protein [Candidatus Sumerlaeota bacterium]|nr:GAF domain-containing protein [Candidatus Sumerlaeota bacterium]